MEKTRSSHGAKQSGDDSAKSKRLHSLRPRAQPSKQQRTPSRTKLNRIQTKH